MNYSGSLERLQNILNELREKCPWDKKQTIHSLRTQTIEELYELTDVIIAEDWKGIKEELGDLLLHILFYSKIGAEQGQFTLNDVIASVSNKLVARHPHIYDHVSVTDDQEVKQNWEKIKLKEGRKSVLSGVPNALPAMVKAVRLQDKARQVGFEWDNKEQVYAKVEEEMQELKEALAEKTQDAVTEEFGDLLFSLVNYARFIDVDPESALERTNRKFKSRFEQMEVLAEARQQKLHDLSLEEMDALWNQVKLQER
ncbi:nucleoside triphosphate pyrophosphohydrolase [Taibaiella chishuiensis]|uniref:Nucleoside triphosphate pyrophosphohydrolase n=1 Tax=Taibaiella chishuiensis TaxID=1434707 RepID=A0A2P8CVW0_9BACT|nr:nucleoside triphosphate pyrophosphohydrolase [Taibaiella chishuiensis]PSK89069.1 XTP/dITP diphosphohydrolase [Taibaiella chishuiensis]